MHQQWTRWAIFLDQWTKAMQESQEVHVLGDVNYNYKMIDRYQGSTNTAIAEATKDIILAKGVTQCINQNTRFPLGK